MGSAAAIGAIVSVVVGAVGAGVSYSSQRSAAEQQGNLALMNAQAGTQGARQQGQLAVAQAQANQVLSSKEQAAALANAAALRAQAEAGSRISQENTRRSREEMARMIALQRAQIGKAGFVDTGSPLELLAQSAQEQQRQADEMRYQDEMQRRGLFREAAFQDNAAIMAGMGVRNASMSGMAAMQQSNMAISQAQINAYSERAAAAGMRNNATGQLLSTAGTLGSNSYQMWHNTPRRGIRYNAQGIPIAEPVY